MLLKCLHSHKIKFFIQLSKCQVTFHKTTDVVAVCYTKKIKVFNISDWLGVPIPSEVRILAKRYERSAFDFLKTYKLYCL